MGASREPESNGGALKQLAADIGTLVRHELELAKAELASKAKSAGAGAGMLSASAITGLMTMALLTALIIVALAYALPLWLAVLIVMLLCGAVTAALALIGKRKVEAAVPFLPEQTIADVKEDIAWARRGAE